MTTYNVHTHRDGDHWTIEIPELDLVTQARRLTEVDRMARSIISLHLEVEREAFNITAQVSLPGRSTDHMEKALALRREAEERHAESYKLWAETARELYEDHGMTYREVGAALGISFQRAKQLTDEARELQAA